MSNKTYKAWFEKYRPKTVDELIFPKSLNGEEKDPSYIKDIFTKFYNDEFIRGNVLSYGPGGFGKTSLNKIMQSKIVKHPNDIFILDRKVDSVDKLKVWLQQKPAQSRQKIVIIEEMDRLSDQAQVVLKDGPLEKHQDRVSFLATTNNPEKLDPALVTRFNYRLYFKELDEGQTIQRMIKILTEEKINFNPDDVTNFVKNYLKRGLRELISNLEVNSVTGEFIFDVTKALNLTGNEDYVIQTIVWLLTTLNTYNKEQVNAIVSNINSDQTFAQYYNYITNLIKTDILLNYDYIYKHLIESEYLDFGLKSIIIEDYQSIDVVKMKNFHFLGTISKCMMDIAKRKNLV